MAEPEEERIPSSGTDVLSWTRDHSLAICIALIVIGSVRIAGTYTVLSHTWDEPDHIAAGTEWLSQGNLHLDYSHPPLARVAAALGPYLAGGMSHGLPRPDDSISPEKASTTGLAILNRDGGYVRNLALARLGILPFFWIASLTVYLWAQRYLDGLAAIFAVFFYTFLPPVLAHAGLATTDMALTALVGATFLAALYWLERPNPRRALLLGSIAGLAVLAKFSALPFIPVALVAAFIGHLIVDRPPLKDILQDRKFFASLGIALAACCIIVWAGYRFTFGPVVLYHKFRTELPAPEFFQGIWGLVVYNKYGPLAFLLNHYSHSGWWYFFPVVLAVKTPLPFLALAAFGAVAAARKRGVWLALAFSLGILLFSLTSHLNLGVRHVLPVYTGFAIVAAAGSERLLLLARDRSWAGWLLGALVLWMAATSLLIHPDYLAYFNALAGDKPENVLIDSDLDWGQDLTRLARRLKEVGATSVEFTPFQPADLKALGFPPVTPESLTAASPGWNAASVSQLRHMEGDQSEASRITPWQELNTPRERIGKGIWLWYFAPNAVPGRQPGH